MIKKVKKAVAVKEGKEKSENDGPADLFDQTKFPDNQLGLTPSKSTEALEGAPQVVGEVGNTASPMAGDQVGESPQQESPPAESLPATLKDDVPTQEAVEQHIPEGAQAIPTLLPGSDQAELKSVWGADAYPSGWHSWQDTAWDGQGWGWAGWGWGDQWRHSVELTTPVRKTGWSEEEWEEWKSTQVGWSATPTTVPSTPAPTSRSSTNETLSSEIDADLLREQLRRSRTTSLTGVSLEKQLDAAAEPGMDVKKTVEPSAEAGGLEEPKKEPKEDAAEDAPAAQEDLHLEDELAKEQQALQDKIKAASEALPATATDAEKEDQKKAKEGLQKKLDAAARYMRYYRAVRSQSLRLAGNIFCSFLFL